MGRKVGQKPSPPQFNNNEEPMPRTLVVLIVLVLIIASALFLLSSRAEQVPTKTIEVDVSREATAR